ncbi:hypothetical protein GCM10027613_51380 [Microlunatus endophyticus]
MPLRQFRNSAAVRACARGSFAPRYDWEPDDLAAGPVAPDLETVGATPRPSFGPGHDQLRNELAKELDRLRAQPQTEAGPQAVPPAGQCQLVPNTSRVTLTHMPGSLAR